MACCSAESAKGLRWAFCSAMVFLKADAAKGRVDFWMNFCQGYLNGYIVGFEQKVVFKSIGCFFLRVEEIFASPSSREDLEVVIERER